MANQRWRAIHQFLAVSGQGKVQSAFDVFSPNSDLDTRDACTIEQNDDVTRDEDLDCDGVDLVGQPIRRRFTQFRFTYQKINAQILARWIAYHQGVAGASSGAVANEVQTITRNGTVSGGTFTIGLSIEGKTGTTEAIAFDASTATILAALLKKTGSATAMGKILKAGDVTVGGTWGTAITLTFAGRYAGANMPEITTVDTSLTGGGSLDVATTTPGDSELHAISRTSDGTLPIFSFATGDKNESVATQKYGNASVDSIVISGEQGQNLQVVVTVNAYFLPDYQDSTFDVPACTNITPIKVEDCRLSVNGTYQTGDVYRIAEDLNNNIPAEAGFGFDDIDQTVAWQRGDRPTQQLAASVYGSSDDTLYQLCEDEETQATVPVILYLGYGGNRVTITASTAKLMFQTNRLSFEGALRQSCINLIASPHGSPPLSYAYNGSQTSSFLVTGL